MSNTDLMGCTPCKGRGKLLGLGSIIEDCSHCNGIGWVEKPSVKAEDKFLGADEECAAYSPNMPTATDIASLATKKKAGRPKQAKNAS